MKVFSNMKRPTKGFSVHEVALFPTMLDDPEPSTFASEVGSLSTMILRSRSCKDKNDPRWDRDLDSLVFSNMKRPTKGFSGQEVALFPTMVKKLESQIKIGKTRKQARVVLSDDEAFEDDSSKQGRKLFDEEVQEKASTDTELFIQEVTPTEVIQDQEGSEKASDEVSTASAKKDTTAEEVPIVSTAEVDISTTGGTVTYPKKKSKKELEQERLSYAKAIRLEEQVE
ncbi:hypothetical protein Tco_0468113 [Tanacetum coccineum]